MKQVMHDSTVVDFVVGCFKDGYILKVNLGAWSPHDDDEIDPIEVERRCKTGKWYEPMALPGCSFVDEKGAEQDQFGMPVDDDPLRFVQSFMVETALGCVTRLDLGIWVEMTTEPLLPRQLVQFIKGSTWHYDKRQVKAI